MSKNIVTLISATGRLTHGCVGLTDSSGCFVLGLEDNETKHFTFSDEAEAIGELYEEMARIQRENETLSKKLEDGALNHERRKREYQRTVNALKQAAREIIAMVPKSKREQAEQVLDMAGAGFDD